METVDEIVENCTIQDGKIMARGVWLTPKELLLKAKESILAHPKLYDQSIWGYACISLEDMEHDCGTPECIGGWCEFHVGTERWIPIVDFLRADGQINGSWFWLIEASWEYKHEDLDIKLQSTSKGSKERAEVAAEAIDRYIAEKGW